MSFLSKLLERGVLQSIVLGSIIGVLEGDTRSLDYKPYNPLQNPIYSSVLFIMFFSI